jgi:hypothetical protein
VRNRSIFAVFVVSLLLGLSPLAADSVIQRGIDTFTTTANGTTYFDFAQNPLPAGFFCDKSAVFTGRVALKGLPLTTGAPGQIWGADTVIERLDDAAFDANGTAVTRIRFRALSLVSINPVKTSCGAFHVYVSLAGNQRATRMTIYRTEEGGGNFVAPLAVTARISFIPVKPARTKSTRTLEITKGFTFPATPLPWSFQGGVKTKRISSAVVDTNGDLSPDTLLPGASNFVPGRSPRANKIYGFQECPCWEETCHAYTDKQHCTYPTLPPGCEMRLCGPSFE